MRKRYGWSIYSAITDLYQLHPSRTRDWIVTPKANGYQALHLTVMDPTARVEVQIRSGAWTRIAEKGFAAHWRYKIGEGDEESELNAWLKTIKGTYSTNPEPSAIDFLNTLKLNLFSSEIVVFTPAGEPVTLPAGATVLDLAFALHTEIGMHCIAAKVKKTHKLVPLQHELRKRRPGRDTHVQEPDAAAEWESFMKTAKDARACARACAAHCSPMVNKGADILSQWLADNSIPRQPTWL